MNRTEQNFAAHMTLFYDMTEQNFAAHMTLLYEQGRTKLGCTNDVVL